MPERMDFSEWMNSRFQIDEARHKPHPDQRTLFDRGDFVPKKAATTKKKISSVAHTDIDRWLKSVDGLAKDLNALKDAKLKAKGKMDQIGKPKSDKPDDKSVEKEKDDNEKPRLEPKAAERPRPEADRKVLSLRSKPDSKSGREPDSKPKQKPDRQFRMRRPDAEDGTDVKRVIEDRPAPRKSKPKSIDTEENME
jgi:hypothetical protein